MQVFFEMIFTISIFGAGNGKVVHFRPMNDSFALIVASNVYKV